MNNKIKYIVESKEENQRIDIFLNKKNTELSRTRIKNLILNGNVKYNDGILTDPSKKINAEDQILISIPVSYTHLRAPRDS